MNKKLIGRCLNIGNCEIANSMAPVEVDETSEFVCSECGRSLVASTQPRSTPINLPKSWLIGTGIAVAVLVAGFGLSYVIKSRDSLPTKPESPGPNSSGGKFILRLAGSDTLGSRLAPSLVEAYFKFKGCTDITQKKIELKLIQLTCRLNGVDYLASVRFNGSDTAFTGLKDGSANIGMTSRRATSEEVKKLADKGNLLSPANEHIIGLDGIAIIMNSANQLPKLNVDQVRALFAGKVNTFNQVGGINKSVVLYRSNENSGTLDSFKTMVMGDLPISSSAKSFEESHELSAAVIRDISGLGFVGHTDIGQARAVPIGWPGQQPLFPTRFTIQTEDYPLTRRLYFYSLSGSGDPEVSQFISFVTSKNGQSVVERENFVPLGVISEQSPKISGSSAYSAATVVAERLSVNFRFSTGSNQLDNRALSDLDRVTEYLSKTSTDPSKLILIGFTDDVGDPASNMVLSKERAKAVAAALKSRGVTPGRITGFGAENPVASNASLEGRDRNRRVEVWVSR